MIIGEVTQPVNNAELVMPRTKSLKLLYLKQLRLVLLEVFSPYQFVCFYYCIYAYYAVANTKNDDDDDDDDDDRLKNIVTRRWSTLR